MSEANPVSRMRRGFSFPQAWGQTMAQALDPKETVTFRELLMSEIIQAEALINLLDRKGVISKQELLEEIVAVRALIHKGS